MSWYEEKISIKRGTIYNVWSIALLVISLATWTALLDGFLFTNMGNYPEFWLYFIVTFQQFLLSGGLLFAMKND